MKSMDNKGFTLIELIATIVVLTLVMGIASYSITSLINKSNEKDYELLVSEIKNAVELYYQECKYSKGDYVECPVMDDDGNYEITLDDLLKYGFLKSNATGGENVLLINPKTKAIITGCKVRYTYNNGEVSFSTDNDINADENCPLIG